MPTPNIFPSLQYNDAPSAIAWLKTAFGFEEVLVVPGPDATIAHAELRLGAGVIMLGSTGPHTRAKSPRDLPGFSESTYVVIEDVRAHFENARAAGTEITLPYEEKEYGGSGYSARDCEGHEWSFGSYVPGSTPA